MPSAPPPGAKHRRTGQAWVRWAPLGVLLVAMGRQLWVGIEWTRADQAVCPSVFPDGAWPVVRAVELQSHGQLLAGLSETLPPDLLSLTAMAGRAVFGLHPDFLHYTLLLMLVLAQLLLFDIGKRLASPWAGVLAAALFPMMPDMGALARQWAAQLPHALLLLAALDCTLRSKGFSRPLPSAGFALVALLGACFSGWPTDNMLFLAAAASIAAGATLRGLLRGTDPYGEPVARARVLAGSLAVCLIVALVSWFLLFSQTPLSYYLSETQGDLYAARAGRWSWVSTSGYLRLAWSSTLGPALCIATIVGGGLFAWRGRGRAELGTWLLLPLLLLSLLAKKNSYYAAIVYPAVPLVIALGLAAVPWRALRWGSMGLVLLLVWPGWEKASFASRTGPLPRLTDLDPAFQTVNPPILAWRSDDLFDRERAFVARHAEAITTPPRQTFCVITGSEYPRLTLALEPVVPGTHFWAHLQLGPCDWMLVRTQGVAALVGRDRSSSIEDIPLDSRQHLEGQPFGLVDADVERDPGLWLLRK